MKNRKVSLLRVLFATEIMNYERLFRISIKRKFLLVNNILFCSLLKPALRHIVDVKVTDFYYLPDFAVVIFYP